MIGLENNARSAGGYFTGRKKRSRVFNLAEKCSIHRDYKEVIKLIKSTNNCHSL